MAGRKPMDPVMAQMNTLRDKIARAEAWCSKPCTRRCGECSHRQKADTLMAELKELFEHGNYVEEDDEEE